MVQVRGNIVVLRLILFFDDALNKTIENESVEN